MDNLERSIKELRINIKYIDKRKIIEIVKATIPIKV